MLFRSPIHYTQGPAGPGRLAGPAGPRGEMRAQQATWIHADRADDHGGGGRHSFGDRLPLLPGIRAAIAARGRSEEHTSELQSPCNLVCRLLLEKKKKNESMKTRLTRSKY